METPAQRILSSNLSTFPTAFNCISSNDDKNAKRESDSGSHHKTHSVGVHDEICLAFLLLDIEQILQEMMG